MSGARMSGARRALAAAAVVVCGAGAAGCDPGGRELRHQSVYRGQAASPLFPDGAVSRPRVVGTVPRTATAGADTGALPPAWRGSEEDDAWQLARGGPISRALLERGRERYEVFCAPCHGLAGHGDGPVARRGFPAPPSYHSARLRRAPDAYLLAVLRDGLGKMPAYGARVSPPDRRAVIAYLRALQLSQHAPLDALPPALRGRAEAAAREDAGRPREEGP